MKKFVAKSLRLVVATSLVAFGTMIGSDATADTWGAAGNTVTGSIDIQTTVGTAVALEITGGTTPATALTGALIDGARLNDVNWGASTATCAAAPSTGACTVTTDTAGAFLTAHLNARVTFSGYTNATLSIYRGDTGHGANIFPAGNVHYATGTATVWNLATAGTDIPAGVGAKINPVGSTMASGETYSHQIAGWIPGTAGTFGTTIFYEVIGS